MENSSIKVIILNLLFIFSSVSIASEKYLILGKPVQFTRMKENFLLNRGCQNCMAIKAFKNSKKWRHLFHLSCFDMEQTKAPLIVSLISEEKSS